MRIFHKIFISNDKIEYMMPRNNLLPIFCLLSIISLAIPMLNSAHAGSGNDIKSLIIVSGYSGYTTHELDKGILLQRLSSGFLLGGGHGLPHRYRKARIR